MLLWYSILRRYWTYTITYETTLSVIFHNVFTYLDKRLWIPAQVYYEFLKNKDKVALKPAHSYKILIEKPKSGADGGHVSNIIKITSDLDKSLIVELKNQLKTLKEKTKVADKHPYEESLEAAIEEVNVIQNEKDKNIETANSRYYKMLLENLWCIDIDENNDVLQEVQSNGEWRVDGRPHIFELVKKEGKNKIIMIQNVRGANYTSALLPLRNIFEVKKYFECIDEQDEYYLFIIGPTRSSAYALTKQLSRDKVRILYENLEVNSYIGFIDDEHIGIIHSNTAVG